MSKDTKGEGWASSEELKEAIADLDATIEELQEKISYQAEELDALSHDLKRQIHNRNEMMFKFENAKAREANIPPPPLGVDQWKKFEKPPMERLSWIVIRNLDDTMQVQRGTFRVGWFRENDFRGVDIGALAIELIAEV